MRLPLERWDALTKHANPHDRAWQNGDVRELVELAMGLHAQLDDMRDRYHEASGEADRLHDQIDHAGAYSEIQAEIREHHRQKREAARPLPCFAQPGGCSCWAPKESP